MTLGAFLCCFVFNPILMRKPLIGTPVSMAGYFAAPASYHFWGLLGGFIWGTGTVLNLDRRRQGGPAHLLRHRSGLAHDRYALGRLRLA